MSTRDPRSRLRAGEKALWSGVHTRMRIFAAWQFLTKIAIILGSIVAAIGGGMEGPMGTSLYLPSLKGLAIILGSAVAAVGALVLLFCEDDGAAIVASARSLAQEAHEFLDQKRQLEADLHAVNAAATALDARRRERLTAIGSMVETVEAALLQQHDAAQTADRLLARAIHPVRKAMDYRGSDFLTISIFRKEAQDGGQERLHRIAWQWSDPSRAAAGGRSWSRGEGYSGVAWSRATDTAAADVIEPDTSIPHVSAQYPIPNRDPERESLYMSVAAIPILVGEKNDEVWGVVTATSDRRGVFRRGGNALEEQTIDVIRDIARFAGLLAGLDRLPKRPISINGPRVTGWLRGWPPSGS